MVVAKKAVEMATYFAYHSTEKEPRQLREHEEACRKNVVPHWSRLVQDMEDDVSHDHQISDCATIYSK